MRRVQPPERTSARPGLAPLKVLITMPLGDRRGGAERILLNKLRHLDRERVEPVVVFLAPGSFQELVDELGMRSYLVESGRFRDLGRALRCIRRLAAILRKEQPDLILNWMNRSHLYGSIAAWRAGMADRQMWWQHRLAGDVWLSRLATLLPARAVGTSSHGMAAKQLKLWPRRRSVMVHPGIDEPALRPPEELATLRAGHRLPDGPILLGIAGRLVRWKGYDLFAQALGELRGRGHDVHGLIVGGPHIEDLAYEDELRQLVAELGLEDVVTFTGHVDDPSPLVQLMDVFVSASEDEPFGMAIIEAMAVGTAVVALEGTGPREIVEHDRSGVLVPTRDPVALADAIEPLLDDPALRERLADGGRERYRDYFTAARMGADFQAVLESVAAR